METMRLLVGILPILQMRKLSLCEVLPKATQFSCAQTVIINTFCHRISLFYLDTLWAQSWVKLLFSFKERGKEISGLCQVLGLAPFAVVQTMLMPLPEKPTPYQQLLVTAALKRKESNHSTIREENNQGSSLYHFIIQYYSYNNHLSLVYV